MSDHNHNNERYLDFDIQMIFTVGISFALLSTVVIMYLYGLYLRAENAELDRKLIEQGHAGAAELKQQQLEQLHSYGWIDQQKQQVGIDIDQAIALTAERLNDPATAPAAPDAPPPAAELPTEPAGAAHGSE